MTDRKEKRDFARQCVIGQSSRLIRVVIHLGFVSQAEGGETKAATQMTFISQFNVRYAMCSLTLLQFSRASYSCYTPDKGQLRCASFQVQGTVVPLYDYSLYIQ